MGQAVTIQALIDSALASLRDRFDVAELWVLGEAASTKMAPPAGMDVVLAAMLDNLIHRCKIAGAPCVGSLHHELLQEEVAFLRLGLKDDLLGLIPDIHELYPQLAGSGRSTKLLAPQVESLSRLADELEPLVLHFDLQGGRGGCTLWADIELAGPVPEGPPLLGWSRRVVYDAADLPRRLMGDVTIAAKVRVLFIESTREQIEQIATALSTDDRKEVRRLYHGIKGSAANVGGMVLSAVAGAGERAADAGDLESARAILPRMTWEYERLVELCR